MIGVTVYTTGPRCQRCALTRRCLDVAGISYREIDITQEANAPARQYLTDDLGYTEAPVVMVDGETENHWSGFRPDLINRLAARIGPQPLTGATDLHRGGERERN